MCSHTKTVHVLTSFFRHHDPARLNEFLWCLEQNCALSVVDRITVFWEGEEQNLSAISPIFAQEKIRIVPIKQRAKFSDFCTFCNQNYADKICVIANADIAFDASLACCTEMNLDNMLLAITRHDAMMRRGKETWQIRQWCGSYDAWIFRAPLPNFPRDIALGILGCDELFVQRALEAGMHVQNCAKSILLRHIHKTPHHNFWLETMGTYWDAGDYIPYLVALAVPVERCQSPTQLWKRLRRDRYRILQLMGCNTGGKFLLKILGKMRMVLLRATGHASGQRIYVTTGSQRV